MARIDERALALSSALTARERSLMGESMQPEAQLIALLDAAQALEQAQIPFALIGGLAVGIRSGIPRATIDVDLAVLTTAPRERLTRALEGAGFSQRGTFAHSINFRHRSGEPLRVAFDPGFDPMSRAPSRRRCAAFASR